jgi:predicted nucleic acid-binding protein
VILVDASVRIDDFRGADTPQAALPDSMSGRSPLAVGDLIAAEVLQGVRDGREYDLVKRTFEAFTQIDACGCGLAFHIWAPPHRLAMKSSAETSA